MRALIPIIVLGFGLFSSRLAGDCQGQLTLSWNPAKHPKLAGYQVAWGTNSRVYFATNTYPANQLTATITNLTHNAVYYFAVASFASDGRRSPFSSEILYTNTLPFGPPYSPPGIHQKPPPG